MSSSNCCCHAPHRAIEGVLTYLNAFLILDYARGLARGNAGLGVLVMLIITIVIFWYLRAGGCTCGHAIEIPPDAEEISSRASRR
jgi:hypothetical protein